MVDRIVTEEIRKFDEDFELHQAKFVWIVKVRNKLRVYCHLCRTVIQDYPGLGLQRQQVHGLELNSTNLRKHQDSADAPNLVEEGERAKVFRCSRHCVYLRRLVLGDGKRRGGGAQRAVRDWQPVDRRDESWRRAWGPHADRYVEVSHSHF